jgi:predicted RNA-binding protein
MPNETTQKSFLEETFAELEQINEALKNHASTILNTDIKGELQGAVAQALNESEISEKDDDDEKFDTNPELDDETGKMGDEPEVPGNDADAIPASDEPSDDVADLPPADASPIGADAEPPVDEVPPTEEPETGAEDVVDLTGASDEEVLQVFKKMGPEDEIEVVQTPDGNIELNIGGEEYYIKQNGGAETPAEPEGDELPADEGLVAEGDYKQEAARVKEMGNDKGNVDDSRRTQVKKSPEIGVAKVGEKSKIKNNKFEESDKRDDVKDPKEIGVPELGKGGETIDQNVPDNFEHGMSDRRTDVPKPDEIGVAVVKAVPGNMSMEPSNKPNYDRGTKSTPEEYVAKVTDKTTVGIAESVETLKAKLVENHDKLVYTRQKYAEVIADNAKLREQVQSLNENVSTFKTEEEGYKNAIMTLREQFNEVAVFTSNLTHAVKLMTEHATTKEEKNQILSRLDAAKTLTESKQIYESLAASFGTPAKKPVQIDEQLNRSATSGASAIKE